jgi:hypothetical protein
MAHADVVSRPDGGFWADLRDVNVWPLPVDTDLRRALPAGLREALDQLKLDGRFRLGIRRFVVDDPDNGRQMCGTPNPARSPAEPDPPPTVFWDATLDLFDAGLTLGLEFERVTGRLGCRGRYDADHFGAVVANRQFAQAWTHGLPTG